MKPSTEEFHARVKFVAMATIGDASMGMRPMALDERGFVWEYRCMGVEDSGMGRYAWVIAEHDPNTKGLRL